jgi:hypothetical protein
MSLSSHQRESSLVEIVTPVFPRFVSRPLTDAEDTIVIGAPDSTAHDDSHNSHPIQKWSALPKALSPARSPAQSLTATTTIFLVTLMDRIKLRNAAYMSLAWKA